MNPTAKNHARRGLGDVALFEFLVEGVGLGFETGLVVGEVGC